MKKVGFVALIGEANAGKSTFVNGLMGIKILAVSDKPQTTRENIRAIYNDEESQIILLILRDFISHMVNLEKFI